MISISTCIIFAYLMQLFNFSGFMHAHVSYLSDDSPICLFMLTVERDIFFELSEARGKIIGVSFLQIEFIRLSFHWFHDYFLFLQALQKSGNITKLEEILKEDVDPGIPEIKHFMYKSKTTAQFLTSCDKTYEDLEKKKRLKNIYFVLKKRLLSLNRPVKLLYFSGSHESAIAWVS